ncbi:MAG: hypothetical protein JRI23_29725 [Deltaproteobacteria bacterium]|jgi:hypothetical protein|nr:hypothetical protein [Deltaproteobacteria bacterium]MBW2536330.1 hypothetical protein [Deltaproteobacteria bacterium]
MTKHHIPDKAPAALAISGTAKAAALVAAVVGVGAFGYALQSGHADTAWSGYLMGAFFTLSLGVFGVLWLAWLYLGKATWSVSMRRIPEAMTAWLLPGGILAMLVGLGGHTLYHWTHLEVVQADRLLSHKAPFLNMTMFYLLIGGSVVIWQVFGRALVRNSRLQDETGKAGLHRSSVRLSALFAVLFALTYSVVSFYLLMSLDAHWFSTMFAVLTFTDAVQTGTAFVAIIVATFILQGQLKGYLNENHLHSLVKMMFAATGFWSYIYFCQFLLIWYGNIPEETIYFINRWDHGWLPYLLILPAVKFVIPFIYLAPRASKRNPKRVIFMAVLLLFAQFWELYVLVRPAVSHGAERPHGAPPIMEGLITLGFLGLFFLVFAWALGRSKPVPLKDPYLRECLDYHL